MVCERRVDVIRFPLAARASHAHGMCAPASPQHLILHALVLRVCVPPVGAPVRTYASDRIAPCGGGVCCVCSCAGDELGDSRRKHAADVHYLSVELRDEEHGHASDSDRQAREAAALAAAKARSIEEAEGTLAMSREQSYAARQALGEQLREIRASKDAMEARMLHDLRRLEERRDYEGKMYRSRLDQLQMQVAALKANTSRGRQKLYWSTMKKSGSA